MTDQPVNPEVVPVIDPTAVVVPGAEPGDQPEVVVGELLSTFDSPADRSGRVGRTAVQVSAPAALVAIGTWWAQLRGIDLDPGPGTDMPPQITLAFSSLLSIGLAVGMNRRPKDAPAA